MKHKLQRWTPFQEADYVVQTKTRKRIATAPDERVFVNSRYQVSVRTLTNEAADMPEARMVSIRNLDRSARHDWRDFQRIKNELLGPEWEAVELYPAESRLVDTANQFWLWAIAPPHRIPFGFSERVVSERGDDIGSQQRPFEPDNRPADLQYLTVDAFAAAGFDVEAFKP